MTLLEERYRESERVVRVPGAGSFAFHYQARDQACRDMSFGVLTDQAVEWLRPYSPILEVGSGSGYWAFELQQAGLDVIATDPFPPDKKGKANHYQFNRAWTKVEKMWAVRAIRTYPTRTLLMVWPCYMKNWTYQALKAYSGPTFIYVGEGWGGCCADDEFWREIDRNWNELQSYDLPQWFGIHDYLMIYRRKS